MTAKDDEPSRVLAPTTVCWPQQHRQPARWQLDGWLTHRKIDSGLVSLQLAPQGVVRQAGLRALPDSLRIMLRDSCVPTCPR